MPQFSISITKQVDWRGHAEAFTNVYTYDNLLSIGGLPGIAENVADSLVIAERGVHAAEVLFTEARAWTSGGTPEENDTLFIKDLNASGNVAGDPNMDREACFVVQFPCERDDRKGRKVYLRKWLHSCARLGADAQWLSGTMRLNSTARTALSTYAQRVLDPITGEADLFLCSPSGRRANGSITAYDWVEHHEFT